mmetsp:Transcript_22415/g.39725  ORF Transcript_22415/g.39725 Transcript_22415/m.39725 type:complete len:215 (+) Transcript_22415:1297-1941(+)
MHRKTSLNLFRSGTSLVMSSVTRGPLMVIWLASSIPTRILSSKRSSGVCGTRGCNTIAHSTSNSIPFQTTSMMGTRAPVTGFTYDTSVFARRRATMPSSSEKKSSRVKGAGITQILSISAPLPATPRRKDPEINSFPASSAASASPCQMTCFSSNLRSTQLFNMLWSSSKSVDRIRCCVASSRGATSSRYFSNESVNSKSSGRGPVASITRHHG